MTVYEFCQRSQEGDWIKIPGELGHRRLARAREELARVKRRYPDAFIAMVVYSTHGDGSTWRRPMGSWSKMP